jgi:outer membrane protein
MRNGLFGLAAVLAMVMGSGPAKAADPTKVAIFDMQAAIQTVAEGKRARDTLKKDWEARQDKLKKKEEKIQKAMEEFKKQALVLDEKARRDKEMEIRQQMGELQQEGMQAQQEFQKKDQQLSGPILQRLRGMVADIAKAKGYTLVIDSNENSVFYFDPKDNITSDVVKKYDAEKK